MNFTDVLHYNSGIHHKVLMDLQINFPGNIQFRLLKQGVVRKDTSGDRIFNGHETTIGLFGIGSNFYYLPERITWNDLGAFSQIFLRGNLMETACITLYRDSL